MTTGINQIKGTDVPPKRLVDQARNNIPVGRICARLAKHVEGKLKMSTTQIRAAEVLLRKCMPDLQAIALQAGTNTGLAELLRQAAEYRASQTVGTVVEGEPDRGRISDLSKDVHGKAGGEKVVQRASQAVSKAGDDGKGSD